MNLNTNSFFNSTDIHISSRMNEYLKKNFGYEVEGDFDTLKEAKQSLEAEQVELKSDYMSAKYIENMLMIETITSLLKSHDESTSPSHKQEEVANEETVTEDASVWSDFKKAHAEMDDDSEDRMFFSLKNWSGHRFEIQSDIEGENGTVLLGMHIANEDGETEFLQNRKFALSDIEANITGAGWYADGGELLKTTIGDFEGMDMEEEEVTEPKDADQDRLAKLSGINASKKYY